MSNIDLGPLPDKPSLDQLRKQAKELKASGKCATLSEAQFALAKAYGFPSWPKLKLHCEQTLLLKFIHDDDGDGARALFKSNPKLVSTPFPEEDLPIHRAAEWDAPGVLEAIIEAGADTSKKFTDSAHSALSWAITCWSFQAAEKLVELGQEPDLFCAAGLGRLDKVQAFWKNGKILPNASKTGSSRYDELGNRLPLSEDPIDQASDALYIACRAGRTEVARWLLDHGADPNWRGYLGASCLAWAEFSGVPELCALLRDRGASDELFDDAYKAPPKLFPIMVLAGWGFGAFQLAKRFQADPSLIKARTAWGTPLHAAVAGNHTEVAKFLLDVGVDRSELNEEGQAAAELARSKGYAEIAKLLEE